VRELTTPDALDAYFGALKCFDAAGEKHNHNFEVQDLVLRIQHTHAVTVEFRRFIEFIFETEPMRLGKGLRKAERAYLRNGDRITKPSYISRIRSYSDYSKRTKLVSTIDQIKSVARGFCEGEVLDLLEIWRGASFADDVIQQTGFGEPGKGAPHGNENTRFAAHA
jgi:hypothetical protein